MPSCVSLWHSGGTRGLWTVKKKTKKNRTTWHCWRARGVDLAGCAEKQQKKVSLCVRGGYNSNRILEMLEVLIFVYLFLVTDSSNQLHPPKKRSFAETFTFEEVNANNTAGWWSQPAAQTPGWAPCDTKQWFTGEEAKEVKDEGFVSH